MTSSEIDIHCIIPIAVAKLDDLGGPHQSHVSLISWINYIFFLDYQTKIHCHNTTSGNFKNVTLSSTSAEAP